MVKSVKVVLQAVTVWHVQGVVKLTKSNKSGKWIKNTIGQRDYDFSLVLAQNNRAEFVESVVNGVMCVFGFAALILISMALVFGGSANAASLTSLNAQMQSDCYFNLTVQGVKPSNAHKFCASIYGK